MTREIKTDFEQPGIVAIEGTFPGTWSKANTLDDARDNAGFKETVPWFAYAIPFALKDAGVNDMGGLCWKKDSEKTVKPFIVYKSKAYRKLEAELEAKEKLREAKA